MQNGITASSHKLIWKFFTGDLFPHKWGWEYFISSPVSDGKNIFVGGGDGKLYAIDSTGKSVWTFVTAGRIRATPVIVNDILYLNSFDG